MNGDSELYCFHCGKLRDDLKPASCCPVAFHGVHSFAKRKTAAWWRWYKRKQQEHATLPGAKG